MAKKKLKVTQIKSSIGYRKRAKETLVALGLKKINSSVIKEDTIAIRGMLNAVSHLLKIEEI